MKSGNLETTECERFNYQAETWREASLGGGLEATIWLQRITGKKEVSTALRVRSLERSTSASVPWAACWYAEDPSV